MAEGTTAGLLARGAVIATATVFGLSYSLAAPLMALALTRRGLDETLVGLNAAMHAAGVLIAAPLLPRLAARFAPRALALVALLVTAAVLAILPFVPWIWMWFALRLLLGMAAETLFVLSETWTNQMSTEATRARAMATYTACLSLGFAGGPLVLSVVGDGGITAWWIGAALALGASTLLAAPGIPAGAFHAGSGRGLLRFLRLAPLALAGTALNAAVEAAGLSFLPLYAISLGWGEAEATRLVSTLLVGAILMQPVIGWLGDRMDRGRLVLILAATAGVTALAWPFLLGIGWLAYAALFLWGGVFVGIYTLLLAIVGSRFQGADLVGIYATMGLAWGGGALAGPLLTGAAADVTAHGLPIVTALLCLLYAGFVLRLRRSA
ncbi:MAG: MFS transporter [Rhodospirillales bacterium 69-11]|nr:MAG: MFS transporter [Rhodospirillales bacterium 69-11]